MRGVTLLELLVILFILVLVTGVAMPFLSGGQRRAAGLRHTAMELAAGLRHSRAQAIKMNRESVFVLDTSTPAYRLDVDMPVVELSADFDLELLTTRSERIDSASGGIRFFADGSSTGGGIIISRGPGRYRIAVNWLTGRIRISD